MGKNHASQYANFGSLRIIIKNFHKVSSFLRIVSSLMGFNHRVIIIDHINHTTGCYRFSILSVFVPVCLSPVAFLYAA